MIENFRGCRRPWWWRFDPHTITQMWNVETMVVIKGHLLIVNKLTYIGITNSN